MISYDLDKQVRLYYIGGIMVRSGVVGFGRFRCVGLGEVRYAI